MTDEDTDKTDEVREEVGEDGALGGEADSDSGAVLTLDDPGVETDDRTQATDGGG